MATIQEILSATTALTGLELDGDVAVLELHGAVVSLGEEAGQLLLRGPVAAYSAEDRSSMGTALRCNLSLAASGQSASVGLAPDLGLYVLSQAFPLENFDLNGLEDLFSGFVAAELNVRSQMNRNENAPAESRDGGLSSFQQHFKELYG